MIKFNQADEEGEIKCSECGERSAFEAEDFAELVQKAQDVGWLCVRIGTSWEHYCYDCRN